MVAKSGARERRMVREEKRGPSSTVEDPVSFFSEGIAPVNRTLLRYFHERRRVPRA